MSQSWRNLRREISRVLKEPAFRRIGNFIAVDGGASNYFYDAALARFDPSQGWPYAFAYVADTTDHLAPVGEEMEIIDFKSGNNQGYCYLSPSPSAALELNDTIEIHSLFTAREKLDAVNHAINDAWPAWYTIVSDETLIIQKWRKEYALTGLASTVRHLIGAFIEPIWKVDSYLGTAAAAAGAPVLQGYSPTVLTLNNVFVPVSSAVYLISVSTGQFYASSWVAAGANYDYTIDRNPGAPTGPTAICRVPHAPPAGLVIASLTGKNVVLTPGKNWTFEAGKTYEVAIYYGTGAGQVRTIATGDSGVNGFYVTADFVTVPDSTSEFTVKQVSDQPYNWIGPLPRIRLDNNEYPTVIALNWDATEYWGARLRLVYAGNIPNLAKDSDTIPDEVADYAVHKACYYLFMGNIGRGPQFEVKTAATIAAEWDKQAEQGREQNRYKRLPGSIRLEVDSYGPSMREEPFRRR